MATPQSTENHVRQTCSRMPIHQISTSLPSLFRTLPPSNRRRVPENGNNSAAERRLPLVSTECQTDDSVLQSVRLENARNVESSNVDSVRHQEISNRSRPVSQYSESGFSAIESCDSQPAPRRRRREKRRHRRSQQANVATQPLQQHVQQALQQQCPGQTEITMLPIANSDMGPVSPSNSEHLPDILNSHMPPPYSTLPHNSERCMGMGPLPLHVPVGVNMSLAMPVGLGGLLTPLVTSSSVTPSPLAMGNNNNCASVAAPNANFNLAPAAGRRSRGSMYAGEESGKSCCGVVVTQTVSIRWFIVMIAFVGICCAVVGTVLGAMRTSGREHLTVSLLMIGVGIVLITVSGIAWRLTSQDAPSCRAMLGLGTSLSASPIADNGECAGEPSRRFLSRVPPTYGRPHHPYAAMMYPEFQYRPPPPSYQASMQEYRLRLLLLDRDRHSQQQQQQQQQATAANRHNVMNPSNTQPPPVSPPPTYRSQASTLRPPLPTRENEASRPPSYRSRSSASNSEPLNSSRIETISDAPVSHTRSLSPDPPAPTTQALIHVVDSKSIIKNSLTHADSPTKRDKDNNTVTIVQTTSSSQVLGHETSPVLVTVTTPPSIHQSNGNGQNVQVLAQL